jgi:HAD superfamily hydrolase (TIGR01509 family)
MIKVYPGVEGLIFDCDGTLVDTMPLHMAGWHKAFSEFGVSCPDDFLNPLKGMHEEDIVELYNKQYGTDIDAKLLIKMKHDHFRKMINKVKPIKPVTDVASKYYGKLPMAVVSGGTRENVHMVLEKIKIKYYFPVIITADDPVEPKPSPEIFLEAARRINVEPCKCQVFEDGDIGLKAAIEAGMKATDVRKYIE